mgnify:CR=1 FL=1
MKYLVILTKSYSVAFWLAKSFEPGKDGVTCVTYGGTYGSENLIPPAYCGLGYFYCAVTYIESADVEPYRLVIA